MTDHYEMRPIECDNCYDRCFLHPLLPHTTPHPQDTGPHGDTLKELVDNVKDTLTGKKHHKEDDK